MLFGLLTLANDVMHGVTHDLIRLRGDDAEKSLVIASRSESDDILQVIGRKMRVAHGHGQGGMTQDFLQGEDIAAVHDEVAGEGVP